MVDRLNRVLVVDDDVDLARTVGDILKMHDYESVVANTGWQSLEIVEGDARPFPVALIDLDLPDMDGLQLLRRLHEITALTQVVILTGNASLDTAVAAMRGRSYDYLVKPVPPLELISTVRQGVQRWHHQSAEDDLRRDRERFKLLVEALSEVVTVITPDLEIEYQSPSAQHAIGYGPGQLAGTPFASHVHPDDRRAVLATLIDVRDNADRKEAALEFRMQTADGTWCLMEGSARGLHQRTGAPVVVTSRDITERRRLEESLRQSQKMESMGRLAGGVAHDFNNQLTAILSSVDLAQAENDVPPAVDGELREIRLAARRAARLTQQLLVFSRKDVAAPRRVCVNEVVEHMGSMLRRLVPAHVALRTDLQENLRPVMADPSQLEQVIMNLVVNARDAFADRPGRVTLRTRASDAVDGKPDDGYPAGGMVVLTVEDDGEGMSDEVLRRVFEPFFTTKPKGKGTGLGLATCYGIVTRTGGSIRVASTPGQGTAFQVLLPTVEGRAEPREDEPDRPRAGARGRGETILLVEDDDAVRRPLARILSKHGYTVLPVAGGIEALREIGTHAIDLLLTDLVMPGMSGPQVAQAVRAAQPDVAILFTSGYADGDVLPGGRLPFGGELVSKPVEAAELLGKVKAALDRGKQGVRGAS